MNRPAHLLSLVFWLLAGGPLWAAFGLITETNSYTVDTGANLVFKVRRTDNGSNTQSAGDLMSLVYNGVEYQNTSRGSQLNSGFDFLYPGISAVSVNAEVIQQNFIKVTVIAGNLTHYYLARNGDPNIYMATHFTTQPDAAGGLCRFIVRIPSARLPNGPVPSDIRNNTGAIESGDIFGMADGTTRSKHYSNLRLIDWSYIGATGNNVGLWMLRSNHEGDSGGPFYRSLLMQTGDDQEITYILNYGQAQTEAFRANILNGPYILAFTNGSAPVTPDTSWVADMGLTGFVGAAGRGTVAAAAITGRDTACDFTVGFANAAAQYWTDASVVDGSFTMAGMIPGTYTMKIYKNELSVYSAEVSVSAGATTALGTLAITADPSRTAALWRIGNWDGTPNELLNGDKVTTMHPSDVRMANWGPGPYVVGNSSAATGMPAYQWKDVGGGSQQIQFQLAANQLVSTTVKVGITIAYAGGRPNIGVNSWTAPLQGASNQPNSRSLTTGSYRGNNTTYTFSIPANQLVAGTNNLWVYPISGSGGGGFLSAGYSVDCIELYQGTPRSLALPGAPASLTATSSATQVSLSWSAATGATGYLVRRATTRGGPYLTIAENLPGTAFTDLTAAAGTYYYVVSGTNASGSGLLSPEAAATPGSLLALYAFEGNALDGSGNDLHGSATAVTFPTAGSAGRSALFNGTSSHVVIPRSVQDDFTVALWVKTTGTGGTGTNWWQGDGLVDGEVAGAVADWGLTVLGGKLAFGIGAPDVTFFSSSAINDGQWHHVAATRRNSDGEVKLYVDGGLQTTGAGNAGSRTAPPNLRIGSLRTGAAAGFFNGGIDSVNLYDKILSGPEIAALATAGFALPAAPAGLAATSNGTPRVDLVWTSDPAAGGYTVKRSTVSGGPYTVIAGGLTAPGFSDRNVASSTTYHYVVSAINANGEGPQSAPASATLPPVAPVLQLRFDESSGSTAADSSGNGGNATLVNTPGWVAGKINNAIALDGSDDHLTLPPGVVSTLQDFTIATWVKWNGGPNWQRVYDFGSGTTNYLFLSPRSGFATTRFAIRTPAVPEIVLDGPPLEIGVWTHVAVTLSGSSGTLYLNGAAIDTDEIPLTPADLGSTTNNFLGDSQFGTDPTFNGSLDEFQIYSRALSMPEIAALAAPPSVPTGVLAAGGNAQIGLTWNPVAGATGYRLQRATLSGGPFTIVAPVLTAPTFTDATVTNGTTYFYAITALASVAESSRSAVVSAMPLSALQVWRQTNFGSVDPLGDAADDADPDGDGTLNETEFRLGLNPKNGGSAFRANGVRTASGFELSWPTAPGLTFEIRRGATLEGIGELLETVVGVGNFTDTTPPEGSAFYRIVLRP